MKAPDYALPVMSLLTGCNFSEPPKEFTVQRINIVDESGVERLHDPKGRERFRIGVNSDGRTRIEMLDDSGETIYSIPEQQRTAL